MIRKITLACCLLLLTLVVKSQTISTPTVTPASICWNDSMTVSFTPAGFGASDSFFLFLSPSGFTVADSIRLDTFILNDVSVSKKIRVFNTNPAGINYKVKVISKTGPISSSASTAFTITAPPAGPTFTSGTATICSGTSTTLSGSIVNALTGVTTYKIGTTAGASDTYAETTTIPASVSVSPASTTTYHLTVTTGSCSTATATRTITVNPTPSATATPSSQTKCSGTAITTIALTSGTGGTTFAWTRNNTGTVTGIASSGSGNISGTLVNTTTSPITVTFTITPTAGTCSGSNITATVTVDPTPVATATPSSQSKCTNVAITTIVLTSTVGGSSYSWTRDNTGSVTGIAASGTTDISGTLVNATSAPITVTFTITPTAGSCSGTPITATVIVNPTPNAVATPSSQTVCSAVAFTTIVLSGNTTGTTYAWTRDNTGTVTGLSGSGSGNISGTLTNTTTSPITVTFTITPTANSCSGSPITATILVNPTPNAVPSLASQTICSGATITTVTFSGNVTSTSYAWTRNNTGTVTGIGASGNTTISGALTNTTSAPITVTFTVTPSANSCAGTPISVTVLVNPTPVATPSVPSQTICSGASISAINLSSPTSGTTYAWTRDNTGNVTGISGSGSGNISGSLTNTTSAPITVTFTITPTANSCSGTPVAATVLVNPTPNAVANQSSQTICSGTAISTITLSGNVSGTTYTWTRNNTAQVTGIASSGSGNISGSLTNTTSAPITVTFTITPSANSCTGTPITSTVLVNPTPVVTPAPSSQTICSGANITDIVPSSATSGTTFTWTRDNNVSVTGISSNGGGTVTGSLTNTTNAPVTVTFTFTPTANSCTGSTTSATVVVNPTPNAVATPSSQTICSANNITTIALTGNVSGTTYSWTRDNTVDVTGISSSGSGNISGVLVNNTFSPALVTFTITPTANGCSGSSITATVLVNPSPVAVSSSPSQTICSGANITNINFSSTTSGTTYSWTRNNTVNVTGISSSGTGNISGALTNITSAPITVTFSITPFANSCSGGVITSTVLVNPTPNAVAAPSSQTICSGTSISTIALTGNTSGTTFNWSRNNAATVTGIASSGSGNISGSLVNTTSAPITVTFTITPTANSCPGLPITATVLVNPTPVAIANPAAQNVCSETGIVTIDITSATTGTTYSWTRNNTTQVTGIAASGSGNISGILTNTTTSAITVTFTITPLANSCNGLPITATILVNPKPAVSNVVRTICSGATVNLSPTGVPAATTYTWSLPVINPAGSITGATIGTALSGLSQTLANASGSQATALYTITPNSGSCIGNPFTLTITVNPNPVKPVLDITNPTSVCLNQTGVNYGLTKVTGIEYLWKTTSPGIIFHGNHTANCLIDFPSTGTLFNFTVIATNPLTGCTDSSVFAVSATTAIPTPPKVILTPNGKTLVCLDNLQKTYQWGFDDNAFIGHDIAGATLQDWSPPGGLIPQNNYYVKLNSGGCTFKVYYNTPAAIQSNFNHINLSISPNPNSGIFTLNLEGALNPETAYISDVLGKNLVTLNLQQGKNNIELPTLPNGIYYIHVMASSGNNQTLKFIINK